jgi:exodeoxyribonuclease V beta subunit
MGTEFGTLIHSILEELNFNKENNIADIVNIVENKLQTTSFFTKQEAKSENEKDLNQKITGLIHNILNAPIKELGIKLSELDTSKLKKETEFYLKIKKLNFNKIFFLDESINSQKISGYLKGFIDFFFEHEGKYYIADWKTNYLGNEFSNYSKQAIETAMIEHKYKLQYMIYIIAIDKHLTNAIKNYTYEKDFGGVFYFFVRGMNSTGKYGIYFNKPSIDDIKKFKEQFDLHGFV